MRLHQWAKNTLIFVPLLLAHQWNLGTFAGAAVAFLSFGMCASATYIINDPAGPGRGPAASAQAAAAVCVGRSFGARGAWRWWRLLFVASVVLAVALPRDCGRHAGRLHAGAAVQLSGLAGAVYRDDADVLAVPEAEAAAGRLCPERSVLRCGFWRAARRRGVPVSAWLAGFSVFFFLSLAFVKRFSELESLRERGWVGAERSRVHGERPGAAARSGTGAMYAAVVVMTLYINSPDTNHLYHHPVRLWLVVLVLLLWLSQVWMLASRGEMHDDPWSSRSRTSGVCCWAC